MSSLILLNIFLQTDSTYIVALDSAIYDSGAHCGATVVISGNGNTIRATVVSTSHHSPTYFLLTNHLVILRLTSAQAAGVPTRLISPLAHFLLWDRQI